MKSVSHACRSRLPAFCTLPSGLVVLYIQWLCLYPLQQIHFTNQDKEDEDGPPLASTTLYQGSSNTLCTSMNFPTNTYFLSGLVLPLRVNAACFLD